MKLTSKEEAIFFLNLKQQIRSQIPELFFDEKLTSNYLCDYYHPDKIKLQAFENDRLILENKKVYLEKPNGIEKAKITIYNTTNNKSVIVFNDNIFFIKESIYDLCLLDKDLIQIKKIQYSFDEKKFFIEFFIGKEIDSIMNNYFILVVGRTQKYIDSFFDYKDEILLKEIYLSYFKQEKRCSDEIYNRLIECKKTEIINLVSLINIVNY